MKLLLRCLLIVFLTIIFGLKAIPSFAASPIPILMYHYVRDYANPADPAGIDLSVSVANFESQMQYLVSNNYTPLTLDEAYAIFEGKTEAPGKPIILTFDDGTEDLYTTVYPILQKYNLKATSFIITGFVDTPRFVTWDQIYEMQNSQLLDFQSHTINHIYMPYYSYESLMYELIGSKKTLESKLNKIVNFVSYPVGATNEYIETLTKNAGYVGAVGTWMGKADGESMNMPRVRVHGQETLEQFIANL